MNVIAKDRSDNWMLWLIAAGVVVSVAVQLTFHYWRFFTQWVSGIRGKNWPTVQATIDNVSVAKQVVSGSRSGSITIYLATLTYFYRNPDLQAGEYSREFNANEEEDAKDWANSYKGKPVTIHVDPRDPTRSVLTKEELLRNKAQY